MIFIGIDPGANGAIAYINALRTEDVLYGVLEVSKVSKTLLAECLEEFGEKDSFAMIELVHSMPGQGVRSSFNFGASFGMLEGFIIAAGVPYQRVTPQAWQKGYGLYKKPGETHTEKKNRHKELAQELFPDLKITHATADALLIAEYARRTHGKEDKR